MSSRLPSRRFHEVQLLIGVALVLLVAVVVAELQGLLGLSRSALDDARSAAAAAAALAAATAESGTGPLPAVLREDGGGALLRGGRVVARVGTPGPETAPWWPWNDRAEWEAAGRAVAGPLEDGGGAVVVAYALTPRGDALRVVRRVPSVALGLRWRFLGGLLAVGVAGGGALLAWLLLGRALAPYRELLAQAERINGQRDGVGEDRYLVETFRQTIQRLEASEAALRRRADELAVLSEVLTRESHAGVLIVDAAGRVRAENAAAERLLGAGPRPGAALPEALSAAEGSLVLGDRVVEVRRVPLLSSEGSAQGQVVLLTDRTRLVALERALSEREQMASLGELAAGMAHELRNALATVTGYLRLLPAAGEEQRDRYVAAMRDEAEGLGRVLDRFLHFAEPRELRQEELDLAAVVAEAADRVEAAFPSVPIERRAVAGTRVTGDRLALAVAVENLLRNAAEAVAVHGGGVRVTVEREPRRTRVRVEDTGGGVGEDIRARLFVPFASSKPSGGLGLALARRLARLHGGDVVYEPLGERGSAFELHLPGEEAV